MEMDPDFALGMLKTISTFLDFFAKIKKKFYWLRGYVGAWLAFRPGDWGSNLTWAKLFFSLHW